MRAFTEAEDVAGFDAARGILTSEGGKASHAALVARGMGRPCVRGPRSSTVDVEAGVVHVSGRALRGGQMIAIDGSTGAVTLDDVPLIDPGDLERSSHRARLGGRAAPAQVRANADTPEDAARARSFGAEGIGLCRTEHMFFGADRDQLGEGDVRRGRGVAARADASSDTNKETSREAARLAEETGSASGDA